ncbi:MAG: aldo/keto reductase, partial [Clostridia bacterium]|nr:aldo/keto reductase [Clostridia bacterium]
MAAYFGKETPKLGFGLMRLPKKDGVIDVEALKEMVDLFLGAGFTYFDTAFAYTGSEEAIREALVRRYPRSAYTLASKINVAERFAPDGEASKSQLFTSLERSGAGY